MRRSLLLAVLAALAGCAPPGPPPTAIIAEPPPVGARVGDYIRVGAGFGCIAGAPVDPLACNRIGGVKIGMPYAEVEQRLGRTKVHVPRTGGAVSHIHPLSGGAFLAVSEKGGTAAAVQILGPGPQPDWTFSGIGLGTSEAALRARFGEPMRVSAIPPDGTDLWRDGASMWAYPPWSFSFEIARGEVISIYVGDQ